MRLKDVLWLEATNNETTYPRKMLTHLQWPPKQSSSPALFMLRKDKLLQLLKSLTPSSKQRLR